MGEEKEETEEYYFRGGIKMKKLIEDINKKFDDKFGFPVSIMHITNLIADKVDKAGGIRLT